MIDDDSDPLGTDGYTFDEIQSMVFDSVVFARCSECGTEYEVEPDARGYPCRAGCGSEGTVTSPLIKLHLM